MLYFNGRIFEFKDPADADQRQQQPEGGNTGDEIYDGIIGLLKIVNNKLVITDEKKYKEYVIQLYKNYVTGNSNNNKNSSQNQPKNTQNQADFIDNQAETIKNNAFSVNTGKNF